MILRKHSKSLGQFYHEKMGKEVSKMKSVQKQAERRKQLLYDGLDILSDNEQKFHAMFAPIERYKRVNS